MRLPPFRHALAVAVSIALGAPFAAGAESLKELYEAARAYDATYLAAKSQADSAQYRVQQVEALARPAAALAATANSAVVDPAIGTTGTNNSIGATLSGRYPLFNRPNQVTIEQARRGLEVDRANLETAEQDLIVRVAQAYFDVLAAQDTLGTTRASKAAITEQLASAKRNFEVGTATITDTREAQARFDLAQAQEIAAENDLRTKRIALDQLVGRQNVTPAPLAVPVTLPAPLPANPEEWVTLADGRHPSVRRARVALDVATLETEKARAARLPTVDATAFVNPQRTGGTLNGVASGTTKQAGIGVSMNWNVYTGGQVQNRISETLVLEGKSKSELEAARRGVAQGTRVAYFGVQSGLAQVKALEAAEASSKLALEATQLGYRVGVRVNLDVLNAQTQLFTTQRDLAKARYDVVVGSLRLRQASGELTPNDIDFVNQLLAK
jgi:outer membrane protein